MLSPVLWVLVPASPLGDGWGESMVDKLTPMLKDAGFSDVEGIPTRHKNFAFMRAR